MNDLKETVRIASRTLKMNRVALTRSQSRKSYGLRAES